jgi:hypothetical protein
VSSYAVINNTTNVCVNVVAWDGVSNWLPPAETYLVELGDTDIGGIGVEYDPAAQAWIIPPEPEPEPEPVHEPPVVE